MERICGWGRYPVVRATERRLESLEEATREVVLTRGLGRSYGDASLPADEGATVAGSRLATRILGFDEQTGLLHAEAGLSLEELRRKFLPRGFSSPVLPGTQFVTLGGMVAADVHGKNHHVAGTLGAHVKALRIRVADGRILEIGDAVEQELFRATLGGMGLTGHILDVHLRLERAPSQWIYQETEYVADLPSLIRRMREAGREWPFTVCWADCAAPGRAFGQGILIKGRWATGAGVPEDPPSTPRRVQVPFNLPSGILSRPLGRLFNSLYCGFHRLTDAPRFVRPEAFFHPLDRLLEWNRLYGGRGFTQYQCVIPDAAGDSGWMRLFERFEELGAGSLLTVIKDCGAEGRGTLTFPMPGVSVALDLPMVPGNTQQMVDALNEVVLAAGGRVYLAKDALTRREHFRAMEGRFSEWDRIRRAWDPHRKIESALSRRLMQGNA